MNQPAVDLEAMGRAAAEASRKLARMDSAARAEIVRSVAAALRSASREILDANVADVRLAEADGMSDALVDRLRLSPERLDAVIGDVGRVADLEDPVGTIMDQRRLPNGLHLSRVRVPLGVVGVIYESRPNVTVDIASLCLRTGNACLLRGGRETRESNRALVRAVRAGLEAGGAPTGAVHFIDSPDRALVDRLLRLDRYVDMIIPRGGARLHRHCLETATIPVITGGIGICHVFVDADADLEDALAIVENAKVQRPSVCNALDTLLVHREEAHAFVPAVADRLVPLGVTLRADERASAVLAGRQGVVEAGPGDFDREWLSLNLGVRIVEDLDEALSFIRTHGSGHSDAILTRNPGHADRFVAEVDSAAVYVNASTRFTDGGEFGLGAEVAVSTQKLHARGPMGLEALTTYKWIGRGDGLIRA